MNITNKRGGRGRCKKCEKMHNNVALHKSNCENSPIHKFKPIPMPKVKFSLKKESPLIRKLKRSIVRANERLSKMREKYEGNEASYNFHAGAEYGYEKAKTSILEDILDELEGIEQ